MNEKTISERVKSMFDQTPANFEYQGFLIEKDNDKYYASKSDWKSSYSLETGEPKIAKERIDFAIDVLDNTLNEKTFHRFLLDIKKFKMI